MRKFVIEPSAAIGLVVALSILGLACGGGKDNDTADSGDETDVDTDTDTDTDTIPVTTGFARVVNLLVDYLDTNIHLNDDPTPLNEDPFPLGGNTDASGLDYVPFPPADYKVEFFDVATGASAVIIDPVAVDVGVYQTIIAFGSNGVAELTGIPELGATGMVVVDDLSSPGAGNHRLTLYVTSPGTPDIAVWFDQTMTGMSTGSGADVTSYGGSTTWTIPSGATNMYVDATMDGVSDMMFALDLVDDDFSYLYTMPDPMGMMPVGSLLHHVRGTDNTPIGPMGM